MTDYKSGLATAVQDKADVSDYLSLVYQAAGRHRGGMIADIFSGGGGHTALLWERLDGEGKFVAIDADPARIVDMLAKNDKPGPVKFAEPHDSSELAAAFAQHKVAAIKGDFPEKPFGETGIDLDGRVDLSLCNAGIMFVPPKDLDRTLGRLAALLAPQGEMFVRFSQMRADQAGKSNYYIHDPAHVSEVLQSQGLDVARNPDLPDPLSRPFSWVDLHVCKPG